MMRHARLCPRLTIGGLAAQLNGPTIPPIETADELLGDLLRGYDVIDR
jgi:hypothetical protein